MGYIAIATSDLVACCKHIFDGLRFSYYKNNAHSYSVLHVECQV